MPEIEWKYEPSPPDYDLTGSIFGHSVDVVCYGDTGPWSVYLSNVQFEPRFTDRELARTWAQENFASAEKIISAFSDLSWGR